MLATLGKSRGDFADGIGRDIGLSVTDQVPVSTRSRDTERDATWVIGTETRGSAGSELALASREQPLRSSARPTMAAENQSDRWSYSRSMMAGPLCTARASNHNRQFRAGNRRSAALSGRTSEQGGQLSGGRPSPRTVAFEANTPLWQSSS